MKKLNLVVIALTATALLWCLDRATGTSDAAGDCRCETVTITATVGTNGVLKDSSDAAVVLNIGLIQNPVSLPIVMIYRSIPNTPTVTVEPIAFQLDREGRVIVHDEPGTTIYVTTLK